MARTAAQTCQELVPEAAATKAAMYTRSGNLLALGARDPVERGIALSRRLPDSRRILTSTGFDDAADYESVATFHR